MKYLLVAVIVAMTGAQSEAKILTDAMKERVRVSLREVSARAKSGKSLVFAGAGTTARTAVSELKFVFEPANPSSWMKMGAFVSATLVRLSSMMVVQVATVAAAAGAAVVVVFYSSSSHAMTTCEYLAGEGFQEFLNMPEEHQMYYIEHEPKLAEMVLAIADQTSQLPQDWPNAPISR